MRLYESIADHYYDKITLDKLTMDTFYASKNIASDNEMQLKSLKRSSSSDTSVGGGGSSGSSNAQKMEVATKMFNTSLWANFIAFLADYSVHQVILCYGYYVYINERRKRLKSQQEQQGKVEGTGAADSPATTSSETPANKQQAEDDAILELLLKGMDFSHNVAAN